MSYTDIRSALEIYLKAMDNAPAIAFDNVDFEPIEGVEYIRATLAHSRSQSAGVGNNALDRYDGVLFLDIFTPRGEGAQLSDTLSDALKTRFKKGTIITQGSTRVIIAYAEITHMGNNKKDPWFQVPLMVVWYCYK